MSVDRRRRDAQRVLDALRLHGQLDATQIKETALLPFWRNTESLLHDLVMGGYVKHNWENGVFPRREVWWITELGKRGL